MDLLALTAEIAFEGSLAVAGDGDSESVQYQVMDALQEFEDRYRDALKAWKGDANAFPGIDTCFEKVLRA